MDNKLLLVKSITLLYRESQLPGAKERSVDLVRRVMEHVTLPESNLTILHERDILAGLKNTVLTMCEDPDSHTYDLASLLQRLKMNTQEDTLTYEALRDGIGFELDEIGLKRMCLSLRRTLQNFFSEEAAKAIIEKASYQSKFHRSKIPDFTAFVREMHSELEPYTAVMDVIDPAVVSEVRFSDRESAAEVFETVKEETSGESILSTGWQGVNRMLRGGIRRGDEVVIGALQHKYKTGFSLTLFKQLALYNTPHMLDPTKKPCMVRITFEDKIEDNMQFLYTSLYENENPGRHAEVGDKSAQELADYVLERMTKTGYEIIMMRVNPTTWGYQDVINKLLSLEAEGYEVHVCMLDYLALLPTTGIPQGAMGQDVREMYRRMRNFCNPRKIAFITPHQLSTDAKMMIRDGRTDFVKLLPGKGFYDKCKTVDNEVDIEIFIHIEIVNNESYLTIQRGKHRLPGVTPLEDHYMVLKFEPIGALRDDLHTHDTTRTRIGGGVKGSKDEVPFWELEAEMV